MTSIQESYQWVVFALTLWREARGCPDDQKRAVAHVIANRSTDPKKTYGSRLLSVLTAPSQFSSISPPHSLTAVTLGGWINATSWPNESDATWISCCAIVESFGNATEGPDPTLGANHYYTDPIPNVPGWADPTKQTLKLGPFHFYRL